MRDCIKATPDYLDSRRAWVLRRFFERWFLLPCAIRLRSGAVFRLCQDRIADQILIDLHEAYAPLFFPVDLREVPEGEHILDLGAHQGGYAVLALFRFPGARIIAVEPDPDAAKALRENFALNGLAGRAEVHQCGIGPTDGDGLLEQSEDGSWGNRVVRSSSSAPVVRIRLRRLKTILAGRRPFLVKCNCEGGEFHAIPQMLELGIRPRFIILLLHPEEGDAEGLLAKVADAGYEITPVQTSVSHPRYVCRLKCIDT